MNDFRLAPGTVLAEKYRLGSVLGTGGMGTVYQAEHLALKAPVAVKVIDREVDEGDVALARFMREAQSAASLRSPHVVQILDYGMEGKRPFMVMEMLEGEPLADRVKRLGRLTPQETYRVISHVARAVGKAHEADIIHRDLKPDNVFLVHNEGDEIAKVLDFGVAKVESTQLDGEGHTRTGSLLGTPYYMSPEQAQGNKHIDARSDLWALGVIAFECMTGKRPFSSDGLGDLVLQICIRDIPIPSKVVPVPPGFDDWFQKACNRDPDERFQTARDLADSLRNALDLGSEPGGSVPESQWAAAASLPRGGIASATPTLGSETTQPDSAASVELAETRVSNADGPTRRDAKGPDFSDAEEAESGAPNSDPTIRNDDEKKPDSQWEIVPHGKEERPFDPELAETAKDEERSSGGGSIAFVAIIFVLLGGAVVFGVRQAGVDFLGGAKTSPGPRAIAQPKATAKPNQDKSTQSSATVAKGTVGPAKSTDQTGDKELGEDVEGESGTEEGEEAATEGEETENGLPAEDALDAIESAAEEALKEREKAGKDKDAATKEKGTTAKDAPSEETTPGPQPKLPDGLAPAPAPPPPPK